MKRIRVKMLLLAVAVLGTPIMAQAFPPTPNDVVCAHNPVIAVINAVLVSLGFPPIC